MSQTERILTFVQVVDRGSFIGAARALSISKAAISRQVAQLEDELGVQLLNRTTRKLWMTDAGELLYTHAKRLSDELEELEAVVSSYGEEPAGKLSVHCGRHYGERYLLPRLNTFCKQYPSITLSLELAERVPDWEGENHDVIVGYCLTPPERFIQRRIGECAFRLVASPGYLRQRGTPESPEDLINHDYITQLERRPSNVVTFTNDKQVTLTPTLYLNEVSAMKACALQDMGIIWVHDYAIEKEIAEGKLTPLLTNYEHPGAPLYLYYPERRIQPPKVQAFIKFITTGSL